MTSDRLRQQLAFVVEVDRLKRIVRKTLLMDGSRYENDAEHSWHLALMALVLSEYAAEQRVDLRKVLEMVILHDLVEIDAGDTFCYDEDRGRDKADREEQAAHRIFGLLPEDQAARFRATWREFEGRATPEARFAAALDRLQPLLHNYQTRGAAWRENGVTRDQVMAKNRHMGEGAPDLWAYAEELIRSAVEKGYLPASR